MNYEMGYNNNNNIVDVEAVKVQQQQPIEPVSRTYQYRKVMKPMLERKRRARINRCLDELKELMVSALQSEGENVSKLEKADILELTVRHLHKLRRQQRLTANPVIDSDRFRAGFTHAANEVSRCLASTKNVDIHLGTKLMTHLGHRLNELDKVQPLTIQVGQTSYTPPQSPSVCSESSSTSSTTIYTMPLTPASSRSSQISTTPSPRPIELSQTIINQHNQHHHHLQQGLLKVVVGQQTTIIDEKSMWRPW